MVHCRDWAIHFNICLEPQTQMSEREKIPSPSRIDTCNLFIVKQKLNSSATNTAPLTERLSMFFGSSEDICRTLSRSTMIDIKLLWLWFFSGFPYWCSNKALDTFNGNNKILQRLIKKLEINLQYSDRQSLSKTFLSLLQVYYVSNSCDHLFEVLSWMFDWEFSNHRFQFYWCNKEWKGKKRFPKVWCWQTAWASTGSCQIGLCVITKNNWHVLKCLF